jgi:DNA polymerase I-like protein with 3'-5' exonuclease and polymerase domains
MDELDAMYEGTAKEAEARRAVKDLKGRKPRKATVMVGEEHLGTVDSQEVGLDIETSGLSPWRDKVAVVTLTSPDGSIVVIPLRGRKSKRVKDFLEDRKLLVGHNLAGFDFLCLLNHGIDVLKPEVYDTMVSELAIQSTDRRDVSVNLKSTVARRTGVAISKDADHAGWMNPTLTAEQLKYCAEDVIELFKLKKAQLETADEGQTNAIGVENALVPAIVKMVMNGVPTDVPKLKAFIKGQDAVIKETEGRIFKELGGLINLGSHVQIKKAFDAQGWTMKSTNKEMLEEQTKFGGRVGKVCEDILEWRHANQRKKMYKQEWIDKYVIDGYIHPRIWTCSTDTGRMSSSDPNAQQVPRDMRPVFGGVPGHKMVWADYSQLEVRVAAEVANCPGLRAAFESGLHIHTLLASEAFGVPYDDVTEEMKQLAKGLTFTVLFGGEYPSFHAYAQRAGYDLSMQEAAAIFARFFKKFSGMAALKAMAKEKARMGATRPITLRLPTGLKRVLIGWKASPSRIMNTLIQGGAAAGLKFAVLEAHRRGLTDHLCAPIHDELLGCVPNKMEPDFKVELAEAMMEGMKQVTDVPCPAVAKSGDYWGK